jgi:hypothetical protein
VAPLVLVYGFLFAPVALAVGIMAWAGASLLRDVWRCRHPSAQVGALYQPSLADEAERWLQHR